MKRIANIGTGILLGLIITSAAFAQSADKSLAELLSNTCMNLWPDSFMLEQDKRPKWRYDQGVILKGMEQVWEATGKGIYFEYIRKSMDYYVGADGSIKGYKADEYNIDHINNGKLLLTLYKVTGKEKYKKAVHHLRDQLRTHPRTHQGGFWHKKIYPWQMWLDGLYMAMPFYAEYAQCMHEDTIFNDVANQFVWMEHNARDEKTGLLYHGWDESKTEQWANKASGTSPHFWGRALGWFGMALVDVLDYFPEKHPRRKELIDILDRWAAAISSVQDKQTGLWYDIVDLPLKQGNYPEASASCMLTYTLAKAVRKGYIHSRYLSNAQTAYGAIARTFLKETDGRYGLMGTVSVSGLGGKPYRDGSFEYYISEPVVQNDPKGLGAFILCASEMERLPNLKVAAGKRVVLDRFFNSERRADAGGRTDYWHYTWEQRSDPGFYCWGKLFERYGACLDVIDDAPDAALLKNADVYIIVDPDHVKDNPNPNKMQPGHVQVITQWVKRGGTLVLMGNDSANCDLEGFNLLAAAFGIRFSNESGNMVKDNQYEQGKVITTGDKIFKSGTPLFLKEISFLETTGKAQTIVAHEGKSVIAVAGLGRGKVFVVGDPWLYNEYVDGRRLPEGFKNFNAADDLAKWLLTN